MKLAERNTSPTQQTRPSVSRRTLQQRAIVELGSFALQETEPKLIMDKTVSLVCETLGTDFCKVLQLLPDQKQLLLLSGCGWKKGLTGKAIVGIGMNSQAGYTLRTGRFVVCEDLRTETRFQGPSLLVDHGIISGMSAPIRGEVGAWGVLGTHTRRKRRFTPCEQDFFQSVANIISVAVQRAEQNHTLVAVDENLRLALQIADVGTWWIDPETRFSTRDANLNRIYGLEPIDSTQPISEFLSIVHPNDRKRMLEYLDDALESGDLTEVDFRIVRPDGEMRWLHGRGKLLPTGILSGALIDITERKQAENEMARLAAIVSSSRDAIVGATMDGVITSWNFGAGRMFGYSVEEMIGSNISRLVPEDRQHELFTALDKLKQGEKCDPFETVRLRKDGSPLDVSVSWSSVRSAENEIIGASAIFRDISRRRKAELALSQSQARLQIALDTGHLGTWEWQIKTGKILWSPNLEKIHGMLPGSFSGNFETFSEEIHPDDREKVLARISESLEKQSEFEVEYRLQNGKWVEGRGCVLLDGSGAPEQMLGVCADISERKRSEIALRESEERFRNLAEAAPVMIWMSDESGQCIYVNKRWLNFRGRSAEQELGKGWVEGIHKEDLETSWRFYQQAVAERKECRVTYRLQRHDGEYRTLLEAGVPRFGVDGSFLGYVATAIDMTEIKLAEKLIREETALRASEARFRELADAMPHIVWEARNDGFFDYFNKRWHEYTGLAVNEGTIEVWDPFTHPDDWPKCVERFERALASGTPCQTECRFKHVSTGEYRWHLSRVLPVRDENGNILRWIGTATDIEDQKRIEKELTEAKEQLSKRADGLEAAVKERTAELEESLKTTETLLYTIAHDLRAPLRAMQGISMAVMEDYAFRLDDDGREFLTRINHSAQRMDKLISDLLAYGRLGHVELPVEKLDLNQQVEMVLAQFADEAKEVGAEIHCAPLPSVHSNPIVLRQIIANLVGNALKFVMPGRKPFIEISAEQETDAIRLMVKDNGIGIDPSFRERIFEVFQRLHTHEDYPGTGIGLAIVAKGAQRLGGKVGFESEPGRGSTFWVELPGKPNIVAKKGI